MIRDIVLGLLAVGMLSLIVSAMLNDRGRS
jgi:hypothetical protein